MLPTPAESRIFVVETCICLEIQAREDSVAVETCMSMAIQVDMAMLTTIKARFRQLDLDRNGKLSKREALAKVHR